MIKPLRTSAGLVAGLAALSLGGAAIASAASSSTPHHAKAPVKHDGTSGRDTDNIQSGDQATPDPAGSSSETSGESAANSDGPGGYADPAGGNADTQQEGQH